MALVIILVLAAILAGYLWLYLKWSGVKNYWKKKGVPFVPPHPLLGNLTFMQKQNVSLWVWDIYKRFKSPYVGIWLFWRPALVINSFEMAERILVKDFDNFRNRLVGSGLENVDPIGGLNLFTVDEPHWSSIRRKLTPMFSTGKLKSLQHLYSNKSKELMIRIEQDTINKKPLELRSLFADYTTDIIGITAFGVNSEATLTATSHMRTVTKEFMRFTLYRGLGWVSIFFWPEVAKWFRFTMFPRDSCNYFTKVYKQIVEQRGGYNGKSEVNDLLDALRMIKYKADCNEKDIDEIAIIAQAVIFLQGGFDTSAAALTYSTYELAYHPDAQQRAYEEVLAVSKKNEGKDFDESFIKDLPYFSCIQKEALRKYSPLGYLDRVCTREYQLDEHLTIPKGMPVLVNVAGLQYDPAYYPDPMAFKPDRFLDNGAAKKPYMPFGIGPRSCIGERFSYRTVWFALYELILNFEIRPYPGAKKPADLEPDKVGLFYMPSEPMYVQFIPRK
ncbi:hypothetical protein ACJJTC_012313 [Scirpophaga incertulas]